MLNMIHRLSNARMGKPCATTEGVVRRTWRVLLYLAFFIGLVMTASCQGDTLYEPVPGEEDNLPDSDPDAVARAIRVEVETAPRMELTEPIRVTVSAVDNILGPGITETGLTAIVRNTDRADTLVLTKSEAIESRQDTVTSVFSFEPPHVSESTLPDTLFISVFGLVFDSDGNCGAGTEPDFAAEVGCESIVVDDSEATVATVRPEPIEIIAVRGRTSVLPGQGVVADLVVDQTRSRAYVSNLQRNRVHTLDARTGAWVAESFVGSEPWGLALNSGGDSLIVANSGGTSISYLTLPGTPREVVSRRLVTNNTPLFEIHKEVDSTTGFVKLDGFFIDFSDRPQFIAQDSEGKLLYSTRPTESATAGTVRTVTRQPGWASAESKILVLDEDIQFDSSVVALAHVDSITRFSRTSGHDLVEIYDHPPGFPNQVIRSGVRRVEEAIRVMVEETASDIRWANGTWRLERLSFEDTTFVAASKDREWIAFGANVGPIVLWDASASQIHRRLLTADLLNNASERVTGLALNRDGSLGTASGQFGSYYWNTGLRLLGSTRLDGEQDGSTAGVALHPDHPSFGGAVSSSETTLSFVGRSNHVIRILDTVHFAERGEIYIRDNIVGPLRAGPPLPTDNDGAGASCIDPDCVVAKLYGVTDAGGVVVVDVRRRDIGGLQ